MKTIAQLRVNDIDPTTSSQRPAVDVAGLVLDQHQLTCRQNALATEVEGELRTVLQAVSDIHAELHRRGVTRISTEVTVETRMDKEPSLS